MNGWQRRGIFCASGLLLASLMLPRLAPAADSGAVAVGLQAAAPEETPRLAPLGLERLMEIEVTTVTRTESTVGQSAAAVQVITQGDIQRSGATTIPELFRRVPGMNVARIDNNKWAVSARGFNDRFANKLLVQIDGRVLYNPLFSGVFWDAVDYPLEDIERIEVIRGPGASVWGANAVNGIINIITKSAKDTQGGLLSAGGGDEEKGFATVRFGSNAGDDLAFRFYGKGFERDDQFSAAGGEDDWRGKSGGFRLDWQRTERDLLTFQGDYLWSKAGSLSFLPQAAPPYAYSSDAPETTKNGNLLASWTRRVDEDSSWTVRFYWDGFDRELENADIDLEYDTYDLDFQHQLRWGDRHQLVYGVGYRLIDIFVGDSEDDDGFFISWNGNNRRQEVVSAFLHDELPLVENRLSLILGSKFEHNDETGFEVQPTVRLLWTPSERQSAWAAVSRAVRTPHESDLGIRARALPLPGTAIFPLVLGNPDQDAEKLWAFELGYRVQATDRVSVDSAIFYNRYEEVTTIRAAPVEPGPAGTLSLPYTAINGLDAETYGAELAASWQVSRGWRLYAAYTFLKMHLEAKSGAPAEVEGAEEQSPEQQVYLQSSWDLPGDVQFDLMGRYVDQVTGLTSGMAVAESAIDSYVALDARLAWKLHRDLTLEVVCRNLFDDHHPEFGTSPFLRSEPAEIERSLYGKASWRF